MSLAFLLDENQRGILWRAIQRHNSLGVHLLDVTRVGDPSDLPLASADPDILLWAEASNRILLSRDKRTLAGHLVHHLATDHHSPGIFMLRPGARMRDVLDFLVEVADASASADWQDRIEYIP